MFEEYWQAERFLLSARFFGLRKATGEERARQLLAFFDNPQEKLRFIHVGGTSGKGSTATMIADILRQNGLSTGLYTSPHPSLIAERITLDGQLIDPGKFVELLQVLKPAIEELHQKEPALAPGFIQVVFTIATLFFLRSKADCAVVEVGVGGEGDTTNVLTADVSVITNVLRDHEDLLGKTLAERAKKKAGIIKKGTAILGPAPPLVRREVRRRAGEVGARLLVFGQDFSVDGVETRLRDGVAETSFDYHSPWGEWSRLRMRGFVGDHQAENASLAITAAAAFLGRFPTVSLTNSRMPLRFERPAPGVLLDIAHNESKTTTLARTLKALWPERTFGFVIGMLPRSDARAVLAPLLRIADTMVATRVSTPHFPKAEPQKIIPIAQKLNSACHLSLEPDPETALEKARRAAGSTGLVVVTGSTYLAGELRKLFYPPEAILKQRTSFPR